MISNYDNLCVFYYTAVSGSMSRAAGELGLTAPTVTRSIQTLEQELGCQLFSRSRKGIRLTAEGTALFRQLRQSMELLEIGEQEVSAGEGLSRDTVTIYSSNIEWEQFLLPHCVPVFRESHPNVTVRFLDFRAHDLEESLLSGNADFAVQGAVDLQENRYNVTPLFARKEIFIVGEKYISPAKRPTTLAALAGIPLILVPEDQTFHIQFRQKMMEQGIRIEPAIYVDNILQQIIAVSSGLGYSTVPISVLQNPTFRGIYPLDIPFPTIYPELICLIRANAASYNPYAHDFCQVIVEQAKKFSPR